MADFGISVASQLAATAVTMAVQKIEEVVSLVDDVRRLQQRLIELQALFMDADGGFWKYESSSIKLWVRDLQDAALDAEDAVEIYAALRLSGSSTIHSSSYFSLGSFKGLFAKYFRKAGSFKGLFAKYFRKARSCSELSSLCSEIRRLKRTFNGLEARAGVLLPLHGIAVKNFNVSDSFCHTNSWKKSEIILEESTSVDVDYKVDQIVSLIEEHKVVAVVGMGGSGKTRLLQHAYKSLSVNNKYEKFIWLSGSHIYSIKQLQLDVLNRLGITDQGGSVTVLQSKIYNEMREKDCLVVLDDVWDLLKTEQGQGANVAQKLLSIGFPTDGNRCSGVLISTRDYKVAEQFGAYAYAMPLLPDDKSYGYDLLCKRLLPHSEFGEMVFMKSQDELIKMWRVAAGNWQLLLWQGL